MAIPERDTVYNTDTTRTTYVRESSGTGWFVGIIVALALLAIGYLVFSANSGSSTGGNTAAPAAMTEPAAEPAMSAPAASTAPATDSVTTTAPAADAGTPVAPAAETAPAGAAAPAM
jgi:hypothetical protein